MKFKILNRQLLSLAIIVFYLIPFLFFSSYSITLMSHHKSWTLLSLGLLFIVVGSLALILLLFYWEQSVREKKSNPLLFPSQIPIPLSLEEKQDKVTSLDPDLTFNHDSLHEQFGQMDIRENSKEFNLLQTALKTNQEQQELLVKSLEIKTQELEKQEEEGKQLQLKVQQVAQDFADYKLFSEEQLKQKQLQLASLQQIIEDQRSEVEKRQEQIHQLDTKVHDLSYEIKMLLYLHEEETAPSKPSTIIREEIPRVNAYEALPVQQETACAVIETPVHPRNFSQESTIRTTIEAANLLKKCINIAQKLTGANYYGMGSSRYREFSSSFYAIDQRRLFDNLRSETGALIVVYSQKEDKLLFVNNESKAILGWSPEKFIADFPMIMQEGIHDWKKALSLAMVSDSQVRLLAKTKNGQEALLNCHLGVIPTGLFRHFVIGVLYPA